MIEIVTVPAAQTVGVGGAAGGGSESPPGEFGFSDLLGAMIGSAVGVKGDRAAQVTDDISNSKEGVAAEAAALIAGMLISAQRPLPQASDGMAAEAAALMAGMLISAQPLLPQASDGMAADAAPSVIGPVASDGGKMPAVQSATPQLFDWTALPDLPAFKADAPATAGQPVVEAGQPTVEAARPVVIPVAVKEDGVPAEQTGTDAPTDLTEEPLAAGMPVARTVVTAALPTDGPKLDSEVEPLPSTDAATLAQEPAQVTNATKPRATREASDAVLAALDASGNAMRPAVQDVQTTVQATQAKPTDGFVGGATTVEKLLPVGEDTAAKNDSQDAPFTLLDRSPAAQQVTQPAAARGTDAVQTPDVQLRQQVIDQIVRQVTLHRSEDRSDLVVKLNPPELGTLRIHVAQEGQGMVSRIEAGSDQVRGLLEAHLPTLVGALNNAGLRVDSVSVTTGSSFDMLMQSPNHGHAQQQTNHSQHQFAGTGRETGLPGTWTVPEAVLTRTDGSAYSWLA